MLSQSSPYYDAKSKKEAPRWYMVDVEFAGRVKHFVPLAILQKFAALTPEQRKDISYLSDEEVQAIRDMPLLMPGRLSVQVSPRRDAQSGASPMTNPSMTETQPMPALAYEGITKMAESGGFDAWVTKGKGKAKRKEAKEEEISKPVPAPTATAAAKAGEATSKKRKTAAVKPEAAPGTRKSARIKK